MQGYSGPAILKRRGPSRPAHPSTIEGKYAMKHTLKSLAAILLAATLVAGAAWAAEPVNVNTATAEEISENLKGIGMSKARQIVAYREANGSFLHVDELVNVKGIGIKTVDQNRGMILLGNETASGED